MKTVRFEDAADKELIDEIVYTELADEILIIAIAHASREPGYWRTRL